MMARRGRSRDEAAGPRDSVVDDTQQLGDLVSPLIAVAGVVLTVAALVVFVEPTVIRFSSPKFAIYLLSLTAIFLGLWFAYKRTFVHVEEATTPTVETRQTTTRPGAGIDRVLFDSFERTGDRLQARVRFSDRLRSVALDVLAAVRGTADEAEITEELDAGSWTDDPRAGEFFATQSREQTLRERLQSLAPRRSDPYTTGVEHVIGELAERFLSDVEDDDANRQEFESPAKPNPLPTSVASSATNRWRGLGAVTMIALGVGAGLGQPELLVAIAPLLLVLGVAAIDPIPPRDVSIERTIEPPESAPGEEVTVTVTVENESGRWIPDLRLVDGVPSGMHVVDGTPRHGTVLRPGAETWFRYTVKAERGAHTFDPAFVITRNVTSTTERVFQVDEETDSIRYRAQPELRSTFPLRQFASAHVGRVLTDVGGSGLEFHSVREYRPGDPLSRIDWNRAARSGELATIQFREERAAKVVLLIDTRKEAYVAPSETAPSAVDRSIVGATDVFLSLLDADDRVGLAALSPRWCWLSPGAGHVHWARAEQLLIEDEAFSTEPPAQPFYPHVRLARLRKQMPSDAQIVLFSPLCDDEIVDIARELEAYGYPLSIVSPDPTTTATPGETLARIERRLRLSKLRGTDAHVVDWAFDDRMALAVDRASRRWSR